jgi:hypothetical protein
MDTGDDVTDSEILRVHIQQGPKPHLRKIQCIGLIQTAHPHVRGLQCNAELTMTAVRNNRDSKQATFTERYTGTVNIWTEYNMWQ